MVEFYLIRCQRLRLGNMLSATLTGDIQTVFDSFRTCFGFENLNASFFYIFDEFLFQFRMIFKTTLLGFSDIITKCDATRQALSATLLVSRPRFMQASSISLF